MGHHPTLSLVIPCFNELDSLPRLIGRCQELTERDRAIEVVIVDNGSTDGTREFLTQLGSAKGSLKFVYVDQNVGYGHGILEGLSAAHGTYIGWTHADLQTDPIDGLKALAQLQGVAGSVLVKGSRTHQARPVFDRFLTAGMSVFESALFGVVLTDINAQPTIFSRDLLDCVRNPPFDFSLDLYVFALAKKESFTIRRFPVEFHERAFGDSHWNTSLVSRLRFIKRTVSYSLKLRMQWR